MSKIPVKDRKLTDHLEFSVNKLRMELSDRPRETSLTVILNDGCKLFKMFSVNITLAQRDSKTFVRKTFKFVTEFPFNYDL